MRYLKFLGKTLASLVFIGFAGGLSYLMIIFAISMTSTMSSDENFQFSIWAGWTMTILFVLTAIVGAVIVMFFIWKKSSSSVVGVGWGIPVRIIKND